MQSLNRKNEGFKYLLLGIDLYSKYAFVVPLKYKKGISIVNAFDKIIKQSKRKPNKIWVVDLIIIVDFIVDFIAMFLKNGYRVI